MSSPASRRIDSHIQNALDQAFERIVKYVDDGHCTREDAQEALNLGWGYEIADYWAEWVEEWDL